MTANQINWHVMKNTNEHNIRTHEETVRHNLETEKLQKDTLGESKRHNKVSESQNAQSIAVNQYNAETGRLNYEETFRHNQVGEYQQGLSLAEIARHNAETEKETHRANTTAEREKERTNRANEQIQRQKNDIAAQANALNRLNTLDTLAVRREELNETRVHHQKQISLGRDELAHNVNKLAWEKEKQNVLTNQEYIKLISQDGSRASTNNVGIKTTPTGVAYIQQTSPVSYAWNTGLDRTTNALKDLGYALRGVAAATK